MEETEKGGPVHCVVFGVDKEYTAIFETLSMTGISCFTAIQTGAYISRQ